MGYENNYVLEGGLNYWFGNILSPEAPSVTSPNEEFAKYDFRKSAATALGGGGVVATEGSTTTVKAVKPPATAKAKKEACRRLLIFCDNQKLLYICGCKRAAL
ncbi:MAG: hypothetical protein MZV63_66915 [Marinilabiliales bacterium]|nr:hypothetical protein [Marinilabiliales bacterium]